MTQSAASQLPLWLGDEPSANGLKDPTHSGSKGLALHRWVNWIAGFSAEFVNSVLDRYLSNSSPGGATVLDPFAGVGTTNVEALRRGFDTYGFELNPFPALAARCKLDVGKLDLTLFEESIGQYAAFISPYESYAATYFNDSYRFCGIMRDLLKPGGHAVVVVGNSLLQGMEFKVDEILAEIGTLQGLDADIERIRSKRVGDSIVGTGLRSKPQTGRPALYEAAVIVRRPT